MTLWHNGDLKDAIQPIVTAAERGLRYGQGVFDTLLVLDGRAQYMQEHLARLARHAAVLGMDLPFTGSAWHRAIGNLIAHNGAGGGRWALTTLVTGGPGPRGLAPPEDPAPTAIMTIAPMPAKRPPLRAVIARSTRRNEHSPLSYIKATASYADALIALAEARAKGGDEAILLNTAGRAACCTIGNIVAEVNGTLTTPPLSDGAVDGITRATLIAEGHLAEQSLTEADLRAAKALYLCNSLRGLAPMALVD